MIRKFPLWATIFMLGGVVVLCSLGTWQLKRLAWKEDLLAKIAAAQAVEPHNCLDLTVQTEWQRCLVHGTYRTDLAIKIAPRTFEGKVGYHLLVPLALDNGGTLLVNRGWLQDGERINTNGAVPVTVTGTMRLPEKPNGFVPPNNPAKNQWYSADLAAIKTAKGLSGLAPIMLYAERETPSLAPIPRYIKTGTTLPNNHFQYALFWFSMAGVLFIVYCIRFLSVKNCGGGKTFDDSRKD